MLNKIAGFLLASVLMLTACADDTSQVEGDTEVAEETQVMFNHGVNADHEVMGDSQNYLNFTGTLAEDIDSNQVSVIDPESNIVLGTAEVLEDNEFYISTNMQGAGDREIIFSYDESISIPTVDDVESLNSIVPLNYIENTNLEERQEEQEEAYTEETNNKDAADRQQEDTGVTAMTGETIEFSSGLLVTINSVNLTDEEPNGQIDGSFVRVDFTVDNQATQPHDFNAHYVNLYDSDRNMAELNAKDYYSETIAPGMKGNGSVYFDSIATGPFTVIVGDGSWRSE